jgi:hypothetical protein
VLLASQYIDENDLRAARLVALLPEWRVNMSLVVDRGITALLASWIVVGKIVVEMPPSNRDCEVPVRGTHVRAISGLRDHRCGTGSDQRKRDCKIFRCTSHCEQLQNSKRDSGRPSRGPRVLI